MKRWREIAAIETRAETSAKSKYLFVYLTQSINGIICPTLISIMKNGGDNVEVNGGDVAIKSGKKRIEAITRALRALLASSMFMPVALFIYKNNNEKKVWRRGRFLPR